MASRDKKLSIARKQSSASPVPPKDSPLAPDSPKVNAQPSETNPNENVPKSTVPKTGGAKATGRKTVGRPPANKNARTRSIKMKLKAKDKKAPKINPKMARAIANKNLESKKVVLLKSTVKPARRRRTKAQIAAARAKTVADDPQSLEANVSDDEKRSNKKRAKKLIVDDSKKVKVADENSDSVSSIDATINTILSRITEETKSKKKKGKPKCDNVSTSSITETIEDVISDLTSLIQGEDVSNDTRDGNKSDSAAKTEGTKPKKTVKKKAEPAKKKTTLKKENIENANTKLFDILDLNVRKTRQVVNPLAKRRHSIENFSLDDATGQSLQNFADLPKNLTPTTKRVSKIRQSVDTSLRPKRMSPYTTRSDTPARLLRNGKHRKLRDSLLDGLDSDYKKRRRLCSDFSGSEKSVSKLSGYESDSSFSDISSIPAPEQTPEQSEPKEEITVKVEVQQDVDDEQNIPKSPTLITTNTPKANGIDTMRSDQNLTDRNSNLCNDLKVDDSTLNSEPIHPIVTTEFEAREPNCVAGTPSIKVPEKPIILDMMKQVFNDLNPEDMQMRSTRSNNKKIASKSMKEDEKWILDSMKTEVFFEEPNFDPPLLNGANCDLNESKEDVNACAKIEQTTTTTTPVETDNVSEGEKEKTVQINETPEELAVKENILQALGLQSLRAAEEAKLRVKEKTLPSGKVNADDYTGTLKTVIKLNRCERKKGRNALKLTLHKNKGKTNKDGDSNGRMYMCPKNSKEGGTTNWRSHLGQSSDTAGAPRKSHYSNRSNMDGSSEHTSDGDGTAHDGEEKEALVIPEKASSFSIHPGRLCKDECCYCFGKFGLFDTPCHIAQIKSVERQNKVLAYETHLTKDSCLCDACYRHVARKSTYPYGSKFPKRNNVVAPGPRTNHCHVLGCRSIASNILRRKWLMKMRKNVCQVINVDLDNPGLHSIPICTDHYKSIEHLMVCALCRRRLARNHIYYLGSETKDLNAALNSEGIPVQLVDKPVVCKFCRYFASLVMKPETNRPENSVGFFKQYRRKLLHLNDMEVSEDAETEETIPVPAKRKEKVPLQKRGRKVGSNDGPPVLKPQVDLPHITSDSASTEKSRSESPSDYMIDYKTLIPNIALECDSDNRRNSLLKTTIHRPESVKEAVEISKNFKLNSDKSGTHSIQRLNPSISVRQLFPGEEDMGLQTNIEFGNVKERTPDGWERCISTIQYDYETKLLWQELQKPYGNQSSFLRHLVLLEKYFRSGDLVLSPNASHNSINYSESVQNRLRAYDNIPASLSQPNISLLSVKKSNSGIITTKNSAGITMINAANIPKNTPITISQINNMSPLKAKNPPGLISLHSGSYRPLTCKSSTQKMKIPLMRNWRPNLIPIDAGKKPERDRRPGYVKVISAGKPYHITIEDYNRMCAIKKSFDLKQKRVQNSQAKLSLLKPIKPKNNSAPYLYAAVTNTGKQDQIINDTGDFENSLEKLDKTVENLELKFSEKPIMILPKIPKSLTVIPQTVTLKSSPTKSNPSTSKS